MCYPIIKFPASTPPIFEAVIMISAQTKCSCWLFANWTKCIRRMVECLMSMFTCAQNQVLNSVIRLNPIQMMHRLTGLQITSKFLFHFKPMLRHILKRIVAVSRVVWTTHLNIAVVVNVFCSEHTISQSLFAIAVETPLSRGPNKRSTIGTSLFSHITITLTA